MEAWSLFTAVKAIGVSGYTVYADGRNVFQEVNLLANIAMMVWMGLYIVCFFTSSKLRRIPMGVQLGLLSIGTMLFSAWTGGASEKLPIQLTNAISAVISFVVLMVLISGNGTRKEQENEEQ
jgi:uncharacterized protein with PQ loop repeat